MQHLRIIRQNEIINQILGLPEFIHSHIVELSETGPFRGGGGKRGNLPRAPGLRGPQKYNGEK